MFPIYFDEDSLNAAVIAGIRRGGVQCSSVGEAGLWGLSDEEQLERASERGMALFSSNVRDFVRIHYEWVESGRAHAGIVLLTEQRTPIGAQIRAVAHVQDRFSAGEMANRLLFLLNHAG